MSEDRGQGNPLAILLVEDNASHVELIRRAFAARPGWARLIVVRRLHEARATLALIVPDLVLIDGVLPDGHGLDLVLEETQAIRYPVVLMTSHGSEQMAVDAMKAGAVDYVVKSPATLN